MKKALLLKPMLLLCALIVGSSSVWATDVTETFTVTGLSSVPSSFTSSESSFSMTVAKGGVTGETAPAVNNGSLRLYCNNKMTISSVGTTKFKSVTFNMKINASSGKYPLISANSGSFNPVVSSNSATSTTWTAPSGGVTTITFSFPPNGNNVGGNWTFSSVSVTYETSTPSSSASFTNTTPSMDIINGNTYLQTVNTASGYTGTITYSITANTAEATINQTSGVVTVKKAGSVTVKATAAPQGNSFTGSDASYTLTVNDSRTATTTTINTSGITNTDIQNGTAAGQLTASVTAGESVVDGATFSWVSSKPSIATVDDDGNITLVRKGKTTITASFDGTSIHKPSSATYELIVTNSGVTTINLSNTLFGVSTGANENEQTKTVDNITITTGCTESASSKTYYASDHIRFYAGSYLKLEAPTGYVITNVSLNRYNNDTWNSDKISATDGELSGSDPKLWEGFNEEITFEFSGQCRMESVDITLTSKTGTITLNAACNDDGIIYGTFYTDRAYVMPENLVGNVVSVEGGVLSVDEAYEEDDIVPANTALVIATAEEFTGTKDYTIVYTNEEGDDLSVFNMLKGTLTADEMTVGENCLFYRLTMHNADPANNLPGTIGFWWGAANGGAFKPGANKAYLAVPTGSAQSAIGFGFDDETTAIQNIERTINDNKFYTLDGRRVAEPTKGLYILNGRKVVVK